MKVENIVVFQEHAIPCFSIRSRHVARLRKAYPGAMVVWCRTKTSFQRALPTAQIALTWEFRQEWFAIAPRLRRIATPAAGRDFFPITPPPHVCVRHGTFHGAIMAETVVALLLAVNRGVVEAYRRQLAGELWPRAALNEIRLLNGTHAVIVGFGHVGEAIGRLLKVFGVRITGIRRSLPPRPPAWFTPGDALLPLRRLDSVLPTADHLILVLPSDTGADKMFDAKRLARLPRRAVVYNVGRGNCIDEEALASALKRGALSGACLDVFDEEPLRAGSPLSENLPGLVRLPHASAFDASYMDRFLDEVIAWLKK